MQEFIFKPEEFKTQGKKIAIINNKRRGCETPIWCAKAGFCAQRIIDQECRRPIWIGIDPSANERESIVIFRQSSDCINGPHPTKFHYDEVEEAFNQWYGYIWSKPRGLRAIRVATQRSLRKLSAKFRRYCYRYKWRPRKR